ncbi:MAG: hypothetical protein R6U27_16385 [Desulfobacterales bacterium]
MVTVRNFIAASLIIAAVIIFFFWFFTGETAKIKKKFKTLAELVYKDSKEHPIMAAASARKIGNMFTENCRFDIPSHSISRTVSRENIPAHVMAVRSRYSKILLKFHDIQISFPEKGVARVLFTSYVEGVWNSGAQVREVHEFVCRMEKVEKDWYFNRIESIDVLER